MVKGALFKQWINNGYNYGKGKGGYNYGKGSTV